MRKINWEGVLYFGDMITMFVLGILENDNIVNCFMSYNYCVWNCDISIRLMLFYIAFIVWGIWTSIMLIDLLFLDWEDKAIKR